MTSELRELVWVPKSFGNEAAVAEASATVRDPRVRHYWYGGGDLMFRYTRLLGLSEDAWDIFFIYGRSARWDGRSRMTARRTTCAAARTSTARYGATRDACSGEPSGRWPG